MKHIYVVRLLEEWIKHGKIIVAVDWDDTLEPFRVASQQECDELWDFLISIKDHIHFLVLTSAAGDRHTHILSECLKRGIKNPKINTQAVKGLPYGNSAKPYYNIFIDDRAGKDESITLLKHVYELYSEEIRGRSSVRSVS